MADVIMNITGNIISGQVSGETAKMLSERFGRILQDKSSLSINSSDTSVNRSLHLDLAIPASKIASLSSGEFVGMVADNPDCPIQLKAFHNRIKNDHKALKSESEEYKPLPKVREVDAQMVQACYQQIKMDIDNLITSEFEKIILSPDKSLLVIRKN